MIGLRGTLDDGLRSVVRGPWSILHRPPSTVHRQDYPLLTSSGNSNHGTFSPILARIFQRKVLGVSPIARPNVCRRSPIVLRAPSSRAKGSVIGSEVNRSSTGIAWHMTKRPRKTSTCRPWRASEKSRRRSPLYKLKDLFGSWAHSIRTGSPRGAGRAGGGGS